MLAPVWYDDGGVVRHGPAWSGVVRRGPARSGAARRGPAVLVGARSLADHLPGLGWARTGAVLAVLAAAAGPARC